MHMMRGPFPIDPELASNAFVAKSSDQTDRIIANLPPKFALVLRRAIPEIFRSNAESPGTGDAYRRGIIDMLNLMWKTEILNDFTDSLEGSADTTEITGDPSGTTDSA